MRNIKKNKIELTCYLGDKIEYEKSNNEYVLTKALKFIPYELCFSQEEMGEILKILIDGNPHLKITIEKENK